MVSQAELILRVITHCVLVLSQFFRAGMGPFKLKKQANNTIYTAQIHKNILPTRPIIHNRPKYYL